MVGVSSYPGAIDTFRNPTSSDSMATVSHSGQHTLMNDAIASVQATMGLLPKGVSATVKDRITNIDINDPLNNIPGRRTLGTDGTHPAAGNHRHALSSLGEIWAVIAPGIVPQVGQVLMYSSVFGVWFPTTL